MRSRDLNVNTAFLQKRHTFGIVVEEDHVHNKVKIMNVLECVGKVPNGVIDEDVGAKACDEFGIILGADNCHMCTAQFLRNLDCKHADS
jgi:hypothetical protein